MGMPHTFAGLTSPVNANKLDANFAYSTSLLPWVNAKDLGVVGGGSVDDTSALNDALQASVAFGGVVKRNLWLPPDPVGYRITEKLYTRAGCGFMGAGGTASKIIADGLLITDPMLALGAGVSGSDGSGLCPHVSGIFFNGNGVGLTSLGQAGYRVDDCWFSCTTGIDAAGADGIISKCIFDTAMGLDISIRGSRTQILGCHLNNPVYGIDFAAALFPAPGASARISEIVISDCVIWAAGYGFIRGLAASYVKDVTFNNCKFPTSNGAGVRQATQRGFLQESGFQFERIVFNDCEFDDIKGTDIEISAGVGIIELNNCRFTRTGLADGGASTALAHSVVVTSAATLIASGCRSVGVGGQSVRITHASAKSYISDWRNLGCGLGGGGLVAEANIGDRAHIHIRDGSTQNVIDDCSTDSTALYVVGAHNFGGYSSSDNRSRSSSYDVHSVVDGSHFGERVDGPMTPVVASAAALTLPHLGAESPTHIVSGATSITSITTTGWAGRRGTLVFQGALTLTDGGNIKAVGNFVTAANSTWSWTCDGSFFYETGRAANG